MKVERLSTFYPTRRTPNPSSASPTSWFTAAMPLSCTRPRDDNHVRRPASFAEEFAQARVQTRPNRHHHFACWVHYLHGERLDLEKVLRVWVRDGIFDTVSFACPPTEQTTRRRAAPRPAVTPTTDPYRLSLFSRFGRFYTPPSLDTFARVNVFGRGRLTNTYTGTFERRRTFTSCSPSEQAGIEYFLSLANRCFCCGGHFCSGESIGSTALLSQFAGHWSRDEFPTCSTSTREAVYFGRTLSLEREVSLLRHAFQFAWSAGDRARRSRRVRADRPIDQVPAWVAKAGFFLLLLEQNVRSLRDFSTRHYWIARGRYSAFARAVEDVVNSIPGARPLFPGAKVQAFA